MLPGVDLTSLMQLPLGEPAVVVRRVVSSSPGFVRRGGHAFSTGKQ